MSIFTKIFGDRYVQSVGQTLLDYFDSGEFPQEFLKDPELNLLYLEYILHKTRRAGLPDEKETIDYLDALLASRYRER